MPVAVFGVLYMAVFAKWLLPKSVHKSSEETVTVDQHRQYLAAFQLRTGSPMAGRSIQSSGLTTARDVEFVGLVVGGVAQSFDLQHVLQPGDKCVGTPAARPDSPPSPFPPPPSPPLPAHWQHSPAVAPSPPFWASP